MCERPSPAFQEFARAVIDAGADIFWGHSAHVVQGVEWWNSRLILFDTGNFVGDYAVDPDLRNDLSELFLVRAWGSRIERLDLLPVEISHMQVHRAQGTSREWFGRRAASLCAELGTAAVQTDDLISLRLSL